MRLYYYIKTQSFNLTKDALNLKVYTNNLIYENSKISSKLNFYFKKLLCLNTIQDNYVRIRNKIINEDNLFNITFDLLKLKKLFFNFISQKEKIERDIIIQFLKDDEIQLKDFEDFSFSKF